MFKKVFMASLLLGCLSLSGGGAQSNSLILQAGSFIGILVSLVVLFFFMKMISKSMGCLPSFLILCAIAAFVMYAFGMLDHGIAGLPNAIRSFLGQKPVVQQQVDPMQNIIQQAEMNAAGIPVSQAQFAPIETPAQQSRVIDQQSAVVAPTIPAPASTSENTENIPSTVGAQNEESFYEKVFEEPEATVQSAPQPVQTTAPVRQEPQGPIDLLAQLPVLSGPARVLKADTISIRGRNVVLFGIDAPELSQTCTNQRGQSYNCGRDAAIWLKDWLGDHEIQCRIMKEDKQGNLLGVCMAGQYDIAAALVNAGLAFAYTGMSDIYVPYQEQARANARGLWRGSFYMPWDWRKMQSQKANIKVIKKTKKKKSLLDL